MEGVLHAFGIDWRLIIIQIFNFSILMGALWYLLYTPILTIIKERQSKIEKGLLDAEDAAKQKSEAVAEKSAILTSAESEAAKVIERAKLAGTEKTAAIVSAAGEKATSLIKEAEAKANEIALRTQKESEAEIAKLAVLAAERVIAERK